MTATVLIVGCGDLGAEIARQIQSQGLNAIGLRRSAVQDSEIAYIQADVSQPSSLVKITQLNPEYLVYCVAADAQTDDSYRQHYVDGLRHVLGALQGANHLKHVFFVSSTRMYGQNTDDLLDENTKPEPMDFGGKRLLEAEALLPQAQQAWGYSALRLTGIYGAGRTRMLKLAAAPQQWPAENAWTNRIHRDDAAAFIAYLIQMQIKGEKLSSCYVVTDSCPVTQDEVLQWIADQINIQYEHACRPALGGKKMSNQCMLNTGFKLQYPDYKAGYAALLELPSNSA